MAGKISNTVVKAFSDGRAIEPILRSGGGTFNATVVGLCGSMLILVSAERTLSGLEMHRLAL